MTDQLPFERLMWIKVYRWALISIMVLFVVWLVAGCATVNKDYQARVEAQASVERAYAEAEKERHRTEAARWAAIAAIGQATTDPAARVAAVVALAMGQQNAAALPRQPAPMPELPATVEDRAFRWASLILPTATAIAGGYFGYRLGVTQSNNNRDTTVAGYNTFGTISSAGFASASGIAASGFGAADSIAARIQAPAPSITLSGTGVIGAGQFVGPNSGSASGNSGTIGNENQSPKSPITTTTTTTTNTNTTNCTAGTTGC